MCHPEEWHLDCVLVQFLMISHAIPNKQLFCGFFFLSHAGPTHIFETESQIQALPHRLFFILQHDMPCPALEKFQSTAFDLRNKMHFAPTVPLELCNWAINYILKIIIWIMGSKLGEVIRLSVLQVQHLVLVEFDSFTKWFFYSKQLSCFLCPWIIK